MILEVYFKAILLLTLILAWAEADVRLPPSITQGPPKSFVYQRDASIPLVCEAEGFPEPTFEWQRDGLTIDCNQPRVTCDASSRITEISNAIETDQGNYQCIVSNLFGLTMSDIMVTRMMVGGSGSSLITNLSPSINSGFSMACNPSTSVPSLAETLRNVSLDSPGIKWYKATGPSDLNPSPLTLTSSIQIRKTTGDLYIATPTEAAAGFYKCGLVTALGIAYTGFTNVTVQGTSQNFQGQTLYSQVTPVIGLETQDVDFQCFFSGRPTPIMNSDSWRKVGGTLPLGRNGVSESGTKLRLRNLQQSDSGDYTCQPQGSSMGPEVMNLIIEAIPTFTTLDDQPHNMNVTQQDTVTISCNTYAIPPADIQWFRNGLAFTTESLPAKYQLSVDQTQLTISDVCKECSDGTSDLASIQCNASNTHGYSFTQGYLNVLIQTEILSAAVNLAAAQEFFVFGCEATTDESTDLTLTWLLEGNPVSEDDIVQIAADGSLTIDLRNITEDLWTGYCGTYTCEASNGYSTYAIMSNLTCDSVIVKSSSIWWVSLIVIGILFLLLLLLILCFCCIRNNEGDKYPVDEKERQNGNDPVQEIREKDFKDFQRDPHYPVPFTTIAGAMSAASTLQHANRMSGDEGIKNDYTDFVNPAIVNYQLNPVQLRGSSLSDGRINFSYDSDPDDHRSFGTGTLNRPGSQLVSAPPYEAYPNQIQLQEGGIGYGNQQPIPSSINLLQFGDSIGNGNRTPIGVVYNGGEQLFDYNYDNYDNNGYPPQGQGSAELVGRNYIELGVGDREFSV